MIKMKRKIVLVIIVGFLILGNYGINGILAETVDKNIGQNFQRENQDKTINSESWTKLFGGNRYDRSRSVQQTSDDGYIITGFTDSFGLESNVLWLIKTDKNGNKEWDKFFGELSFGTCAKETAGDEVRR